MAVTVLTEILSETVYHQHQPAEVFILQWIWCGVGVEQIIARIVNSGLKNLVPIPGTVSGLYKMRDREDYFYIDAVLGVYLYENFSDDRIAEIVKVSQYPNRDSFSHLIWN